LARDRVDSRLTQTDTSDLTTSITLSASSSLSANSSDRAPLWRFSVRQFTDELIDRGWRLVVDGGPTGAPCAPAPNKVSREQDLLRPNGDIRLRR
jgi:hypothetical protein